MIEIVQGTPRCIPGTVNNQDGTMIIIAIPLRLA
jgi:hypothetical protein